MPILPSQNLRSIPAIKEQMKEVYQTFIFQNVSTQKITSIIKNLNKKRTLKSNEKSPRIPNNLGS